MMGLVMAGKAESRWMEEGAEPGRLNTTRFSSGESFASKIAWRSVPGPESARVLTTTGSRYGMTRTMKLHELELPEASTAVQTTVFEPTGKREAEGGEQVTVGALSQVSLAAGVEKVTMAPPELRGVSATFNLGGQVI